MKLTFQKYKIIYIKQVFPLSDKEEKVRPPEDIIGDKSNLLLDVGSSSGSVIYYLWTEENDSRYIGVDFWGGSDPEMYTMELFAEHVIAEWEDFGRDAWYLERRF